MTNGKSHMRFRLVPRSSTLDDLELLKVLIFSEFCASGHVWQATTAKRMKIDLHCQRANCCAFKYFSTMYTLGRYCWAIPSGGRFSELRPIIYQGCRTLTFALEAFTSPTYCRYLPGVYTGTKICASPKAIV